MSEKQNKLYSVYWKSPHDGDSILTVAVSADEAYEKALKKIYEQGESPSFICPAVEISEVDGYKISPIAVEEACIILREELMKHGEIYRGFCASIKSAMNDSLEAVFANDDEMAELIVRRIIGDD